MAIVLIHGACDLAFAGKAHVDIKIVPKLRANLVQRDNIVGVGNGDDEAFALPIQRHRKQVLALCEIAWDQFQCRGIHHDLGKIDALKTEFFRQRVAQGGLGDETQLDQQPAHRLIVLELLKERDSQLIFGQYSLRNQYLTDMALGLRSDRRALRGVHRSSSCARVSACLRSNPTGRVPARATAFR